MTQKERFAQALKEARREGVKVRQNVQCCCRGCITPDMIGLKDEEQPYAFTFGGQGDAYAWDEDTVVTRASLNKAKNRGFGRTVFVEQVFFNWGNDSANVLVEAFERNGFDVEWDGSEYNCVVVNFE